MKMSLSDCLESDKEDASITKCASREQLRKALFERLSAEMISSFVQEDARRARREITAALNLQLQTSEFSSLSYAEGQRMVKEVVDMAVGLGPLEELLANPAVTEIMVNGTSSVFFEKEGRLHKSTVMFSSEDQLRAVIERIVAPIGRRVDEQSPMVSARLPEGHRVNVIIPPLALDGPVLTIRKFREAAFTLDELVERGSLENDMAQLLSWAVKARKNIAVSGSTGSGKTTLLNALSCQIAPSERIITIEDSAELKFSKHPHVVRLEARGMNTEGAGEVSIRDLVINALRMRPDRIVVGECRGAEAVDMLQAMNTGHDGSMTTLHANSPSEVISRLIMMVRYGVDLPVSVIEEQIASALDLIVQQDRFGSGKRQITAIVSVKPAAHEVKLTPVVLWDRHTKTYRYHVPPDWIDELKYLDIASSREVDSWRASARLS